LSAWWNELKESGLMEKRKGSFRAKILRNKVLVKRPRVDETIIDKKKEKIAQSALHEQRDSQMGVHSHRGGKLIIYPGERLLKKTDVRGPKKQCSFSQKERRKDKMSMHKLPGWKAAPGGGRKLPNSTNSSKRPYNQRKAREKKSKPPREKENRILRENFK